jgi:hypothetical protein
MTELLDCRLRGLTAHYADEVAASAPDLDDIRHRVGRRMARQRQRRLAALSLWLLVAVASTGALLRRAGDPSSLRTDGPGAPGPAPTAPTGQPGITGGTAPPTPTEPSDRPPCPPDERSTPMTTPTIVRHLAVATGLIAAASCQPGATAGPTPDATAPVTEAPPAGPGPTAATTPTAPTPTSMTTSGLSRCHHTDLALSIVYLGENMGNRHGLIIFTNTSARPCTMQGFPGVSFLTAAGTPAGPPATRMIGSPVPTTLEPGGAAHAYLHGQVAENYGPPACTPPVEAVTIQVIPPDETTPLTAPYQLTNCPDIETNSVGPVYPGTEVVPGEDQGA